MSTYRLMRQLAVEIVETVNKLYCSQLTSIAFFDNLAANPGSPEPGGCGVRLHQRGKYMSEQAASSVAGTMASPVARLEPDAIGVAQDTVIGMASSAPAATVGLSIAALVIATG